MSQHSHPVVLVVDDVPENVKLLRGMLGTASYQVLSANDGATALHMAQALQPDLILLDVTMPGMDGYAVCARLKENEATRQIPVIFVTARDDPQAEARGFSMGAVDYITKPIMLPTVLARVKAHLAVHDRQRRLEDMFRDVIEFAPDAFVLADTTGQIVQVNSRAEQLFGYYREELTGRPVEVLIPLDLRGRHEVLRDDYLRHPRRLVMTTTAQCVRKDGSEFSAEINLSPMETRSGTLLMAVVRDVTERHRAELELRESRQRLRELVAQNEAIREDERKHIAREIHDELGQVLTALRMELSLLEMRFGALDPALGDKTQSMKGLIDRAIQGVRNAAGNLRPSALDMGLVPAIEWLGTEFTSRTAIPCVVEVQQQDIELDETRSVVVFRIVQESLTNIGRYAQASHVDITLGRRADALWLRVRDDGLGFDLAAASQRRSFGLLGMRERAIALGGRVDIRSAPGQGTTIEVSIPLELHAEQAAP